MPTITIDTREGHLGITCSTSDVCYGVNVDDVHPKDLCALAGLRKSMVIVAIDDQFVDAHEWAMDLMNGAKAEGKKLKIEYLTEAEAKERGAAETKIFRKRCFGGILVVLALVLLAVAAVYAGVIKLPELPGDSPKDGGFKGDPFDSPEMQLMKEKFQSMADPEMLEKLKEMGKNMLGAQGAAAPSDMTGGAAGLDPAANAASAMSAESV